MLQNAVELLKKGLSIDDILIYTKNASGGRFLEELNLDIYLKKATEETFLMYMKVFLGRKPYCRQWVELFNIKNNMDGITDTIEYFGSHVEIALISLVAKFIEPGGKIFIEYENDLETKKQLNAGFPMPITRLGYILFKEGFTWFKDWYFPEGYMEGGQKLQAEKPLDDGVEDRQLAEIDNEVKAFLETINNVEPDKSYVARAIKRARDILKQ